MSEIQNRIISVAACRPHPRNYNRHDPAQIVDLRTSLRIFGQVRSIVVQDDGHGGFLLVAGHGVHVAARLEGFTDLRADVIPVDWDEEKVLAYLAADNELAKAANADQEQLARLLADVRDAQSEQMARIAAGGGDRLDELLALIEPIEVAEDPGAQVDKGQEFAEKYGTDVGQVWQIGEHRLAVGDCTDAAVVGAVMRGQKAGAAVTDPPYGIGREGILNDDPDGLRVLFDEMLAVMPVTDAIIVAFQSPRLFPVWLDAVRAAGHKFERMLWMYKPNDETFPWRGWLQISEAILVSSMGKGRWLEVRPYAHDCYSPTTLGRELPKEWGKVHASVKPLVVVRDLVSRVDGIIYDPFVGSGTTIVACEQLGRACRAVELSPSHCAVVLERLVGLGLTPRLMNSD